MFTSAFRGSKIPRTEVIYSSYSYMYLNNDSLLKPNDRMTHKTKDCKFVLNDNQGPRPLATSPYIGVFNWAKYWKKCALSPYIM